MTQPTPRERIENLWDRATPVAPLLDAYRDDIAIDIGRHALRAGLQPHLTRLVGEANAKRLLDEYRAAVLDDAIKAVLGRVEAYEGMDDTAVRLNRERSAIADLLRRMAEEARS